MRPTGLLLIVLGVFVIGRLVTKDSKGETLAGRLIGGQPSSSSTSQLAAYAPSGSSSGTYTTGVQRVVASQATGLAARTHSPAFARDVLRSLGDPQTAANVSSVTAWINREGNLPAVDRFNPLDTTLGGPEFPGAVSTNTIGVKSYTSWAQGVTATARTIAGGNFSAIAAALKAGIGLNPATNSEQSRELQSRSGGGYGTF